MFVLPRMVVVFDLPVKPDGEIVVVDETDDGREVFERVAKGIGAAASVGVGDRVWAETTIELGRIFGLERLRTGSRLVNRLSASRPTRSSMRCGAPAGPSRPRWPPPRRGSSRA